MAEQILWGQRHRTPTKRTPAQPLPPPPPPAPAPNNPRDAEEAVKRRDGYEFYGTRIRVEFARGGGPPGGGGGGGYDRDRGWVRVGPCTHIGLAPGWRTTTHRCRRPRSVALRAAPLLQSTCP